MTTGDDHDNLRGAIRALQVLMAALAWIAISFMGLVVFLMFERSGGPAAGGRKVLLGLPALTVTAVLMGTGCLAAWFLTYRLVIVGRLRAMAERTPTPAWSDERSDGEAAGPPSDGELLTLYQVQFLIVAALLEGGALYALLVYLLERHYLAIVVAFILLAALSARFPTIDRARAWIDDKRGLLETMGPTPR